MSEIWKSVVNYEGLYEVSNFGRIRSFTRPGEPVIKATCDNGQGYLITPLTKEKKHRTFAIHRLVAIAFLGPCDKGIEVNHKNGIKKDNTLTNLEYVTRRENLLHRHRVLGMRLHDGTKNGRHKLTDDDVREIRILLGKGGKIAEIGRKFGVSEVSISYIRLRRTWRHILP